MGKKLWKTYADRWAAFCEMTGWLGFIFKTDKGYELKFGTVKNGRIPKADKMKVSGVYKTLGDAKWAGVCKLLLAEKAYYKARGEQRPAYFHLVEREEMRK